MACPKTRIQLKVSKTPEDPLRPELGGNILRLEVVEADWLDERIFVFQKDVESRFSPENLDLFYSIASVAQMSTLPADAPTDDEPFYRLSILQVVFESLGELETFYKKILAEIKKLKAANDVAICDENTETFCLELEGDTEEVVECPPEPSSSSSIVVIGSSSSGAPAQESSSTSPLESSSAPSLISSSTPAIFTGPAEICVAGGGTALANGTYAITGTVLNGAYTYEKVGDSNYQIQWNGTWWEIKNYGTVLYRQNAGNQSALSGNPFTSWALISGQAPAPQTTPAACPGPPASSSSEPMASSAGSMAPAIYEGPLDVCIKNAGFAEVNDDTFSRTLTVQDGAYTYVSDANTEHKISWNSTLGRWELKVYGSVYYVLSGAITTIENPQQPWSVGAGAAPGPDSWPVDCNDVPVAPSGSSSAPPPPEGSSSSG